jgi:toxin-antitoxin system PIN domain toxin
MSVRLLDVNVLVSLLDSAHVHHGVAVAWFRKTAAAEGWATCPVTENGFIRIVSHVSYPNLRVAPAVAAESLTRFKAGFSGVHRFWADDISLGDLSRFDLRPLTGSRQTTDAYLAGLAFSKGARIATLDAAIPWRVVIGADAALVERIAV